MTTFQTNLDALFPAARPTIAFVGRAQAALLRAGFTARNALPLVVLCSDELTDGLRSELRRSFGPAFDGSCLAAVPSLGPTGVAAALAHVPVVAGRGRLVCFAVTHVGLGADGEVGACVRPGRSEPSTACGALAALRARVAEGDTGPLGAEDAQYRWVVEHVLPRMPAGRVPDLAEMARHALDAATALLERDLEDLADPARLDWALVTGIQVHGPAGRDYVWPARGLACIAGRHEPLDLG